MGPKRPNKENVDQEFDNDVFQELLNCPQKKKMILQLLSDNKHIIAKHREMEMNSSVEKLKPKKRQLESPSALYRRKALEQMNNPSTSSSTNSLKLDSPSSSTSTETVPLNQVLKGVIAYVEVKNSYDEDHSAGAKIVLKSMGAVVREKFTRDVTHVIFKDGCYQTYQKAKLLKVHLVSILWIQFCRKTLQRQKEKLYPALKGAFANETIVCSQLQKEYEEIVRNEYKKSIIEGTPLPTTASLISLRRTLMTAPTADCSSSDSFKTAEDGQESSYQANTESMVLNELKSVSVDSGSETNSSSMELTCVPETLKKMTSTPRITRRRSMNRVDSTLSSSNQTKNGGKSKQDSIIFTKNTAGKSKSESSTSMSSLKLTSESGKSMTMSPSHISSEMPELKLSSQDTSTDSEIASPVKQPRTSNLSLQIEKLPNLVGERKMRRKLYNPNDSIPLSLINDDDKEREERKQFCKRKQVTGINPLAGFVFNRTNEESQQEEEEEDQDIELNNYSPPKKAKKPVLNESADEQRDLLNEVLKNQQKDAKPTTPMTRKSMRIEAQKTPLNRRSTLEFVATSQVLCKKKPKKKIDKTKLPTIVCTKLHRDDVQLFGRIVKKLGRFVIEDEVSERTTHLVAGEPKRTINMLRAISRGCWVVKFEWLLQSLENEKWLPEEHFELTEFSSAVQKSRLERQAFGSNYTLDVFETTPPIYVAPSTNPRSSDLKELITICKGKVVSAARMAKIIVGQYVKQDETKCVNETWVLDCITLYRRMPFKKKYLLKTKRESVVV